MTGRLPGRRRPSVDDLGRPRNEAARELAATGTDPDEPTELERLVGWLDERTGLAGIARTTLRKVFPDHWSFLLGEIALFCFLILLTTGVFLTFFYVPSASPVVYEGAYEPLRGAEISQAFASVVHLSLEVPAGLLMRQVHHWTAVVFVAVIVTHLARVFFTGAFRRPRELNWLLGFLLLVFALAEGFTGYSLPDDLLSGTGARIAYSAVVSVPFAGPYLASLVFGGEFPTLAFVPRFFALHVMLLPALFAAVIAAHVGLVFLQKHTQYRGGRAREDNVVGRHFWPGQAFLSTGLFFLTAAVMALMGGLVQINPVWAYGPFEPAIVSSPAQPDWYVGWLDGALRIFPPFEPVILGITIPSAFIPGVVVPGALFTIVAVWPWLERRFTRDTREHHLLDRPWEAPGRAATGAAILALFAVLTLAGGNDVLAVYLDLSVEGLTRIFQVLAVALPVVTWLVTWLLCRGRLARPGSGAPDAAPPRGGVAIRRGASGGVEAATAVALAGCLPAPATVEARRTADLYAVFIAIAGVVVVIVLGLTLLAIVRDRRRPGDDALPRQVHGDLRLELVWTGLPILTIVVLLVLTVLVLNTFDDAVRAGAGAEIRATAHRWGWRFEYPGEDVRVEGIGRPGPEVYVPVGENVRVTLASEDVNHAFYVPRFLFKRDAIPGRETVFAFTVEEPGRYGGQCAEFCGIYHSAMPFTVVAVSRAEYDAWIDVHAGAAVAPGAVGPGAAGPTP